jgi:hypothetical protein
MQVQIRFIASGSSSATGNFAPGDLLRCGAAHARHLVDDCACAVYVDAAVQASAPTEQPAEATSPATKRARRANGA